jgi:hypothetical protein
MRKHLHKHLILPFIEHYLHRYHKPWKHHGPTMLVIDLTLASLAAMVLVGGIFAYYLLPPATPWAGMNVDVIGPGDIQAGGAGNLVVSWSNDTPDLAACATLRIFLPKTVAALGPVVGGSETAKPCLSPGTASITGAILVPLGDLQPAARGSVKLPVRFFGTGDRPPVTVSSDLLYWEAGATRISRASGSRSWPTTASVLKLSADWPAKTVLGRDTTLVIKYENVGAEVLSDARLKVDAPSGFYVAGTTPMRDGNGEFRLAKVAPGAKGTITLHGRFSYDASEASPFTVVARLITPEYAGPIAILHTRADASAADLQVTTEVLSPAGTIGLEPGTEVRFAVRYANAGGQPISHVSLWLDEPVLEGAAVGLVPESGSWDERSNPELASVAPGASGLLNGSFTVRPDALATTGRMTISVLGKGFLSDDAVRPVLVIASPLDFALTASTSLTARAMYYTPGGDQLGVGPLPPRVGDSTRYWVSLGAAVTGREAKDVSVTAVLPPGITWTGRASATAGLAPQLDATTRRLTWDIGTLSPADQAVASFEVSLTPSEADLGHVINLLRDIRLSARDSVTGMGLDKNAASLTTALEGDSRAAGLGQVEPAVKPAKAPKVPKE